MSAYEFQKKFWAYLTASKSAYRKWERFPDSKKSTTGKFPHGSYVAIYANRRTVRNPLTPPNGAIIVQENYAADKKTLKSISVMYRAAGYSPKHGDWYWTQYLIDGSLARTSPAEGNLPIAGRTASCIKCHRTAGGGDLLFANDRLGRSSADQTADGPSARSPRR
ncbi:MAG: cytochrome P460 family protein [Planctomycetes bacterium]|nr:cytochrome P460 family protein [Planctomycetota bacterium]